MSAVLGCLIHSPPHPVSLPAYIELGFVRLTLFGNWYGIFGILYDIFGNYIDVFGIWIDVFCMGVWMVCSIHPPPHPVCPRAHIELGFARLLMFGIWDGTFCNWDGVYCIWYLMY